MENLQKFAIVLALVGGMYFVLSRNRAKDLEDSEVIQTVPSYQEPAEEEKPPALPAKVADLPAQGKVAVKEAPPIQKISEKGPRPKDTLSFVIEDGVAVVQGDVVVGELVDDDGTTAGIVKAPSLRLWKSSTIPFYIQPNMQNPERVLRALELFSGTVIHFVPYKDEQDVMVFVEGTGVCKSYVGNVGGKQPLWIAPNCAPDDIAHEILHALGFVHEQNRTDRDHYITMFPDNIDEQFKDNFTLLPASLMAVSGQTAFDFESLMMYPPNMFSKNGQPTMQSRLKDQEIRPSQGLSAKDIERLTKAYGAR